LGVGFNHPLALVFPTFRSYVLSSPAVPRIRFFFENPDEPLTCGHVDFVFRNLCVFLGLIAFSLLPSVFFFPATGVFYFFFPWLCLLSLHVPYSLRYPPALVMDRIFTFHCRADLEGRFLHVSVKFHILVFIRFPHRISPVLAVPLPASPALAVIWIPVPPQTPPTPTPVRKSVRLTSAYMERL